MSTENEKYTNILIKNLDGAELEITGEIPYATVSMHRKAALEHLNQTFKFDGFRPGHIPESVLIAKVGEVGILEQMAEYALSEAFVAIIRDNTIDALGHPHIAITKMAPSNPVGFKITTATMPKIDLPDYKNIAREVLSEKEDIIVEQKEVDEAILQIRKAIHHHKGSGILGPDGKPLPAQEIPDAELPPLDDDMVKSIGDFKDAAEFTSKLKENIHAEKTTRNKEKKRAEMLEKIAGKTTFPLPRPFVESEIAKMFAQFEGDLRNAGIPLDDYLKQINKTPEVLRNEWLPDAKKRARGELILREIAKRENITIPENELTESTKLLKKRHPDTTEEDIRAYLQHILTNSKVFDFLENENSVSL